MPLCRVLWFFLNKPRKNTENNVEERLDHFALASGIKYRGVVERGGRERFKGHVAWQKAVGVSKAEEDKIYLGASTGNCPVLQANQWRTESVHVSNWYSNHRTGPPRPPGDRGIVGRRQRISKGAGWRGV